MTIFEMYIIMYYYVKNPVDFIRRVLWGNILSVATVFGFVLQMVINVC